MAAEVGRLLAGRDVVVVCGGLGGVMAAVARGVHSGGGMSVGILPGQDTAGAAPDLTVALPTGMGEMRNVLLARMGAGMLAIGGGYGTLSEIAFARRLDRPVALLASWRVQPPSGGNPSDECLREFTSAQAAVDWLLDAIRAA